VNLNKLLTTRPMPHYLVTLVLPYRSIWYHH